MPKILRIPIAGALAKVWAALGRLSGVTTENVKKLIMRAIEEYRNDRDAPGEQITTIT